MSLLKNKTLHFFSNHLRNLCLFVGFIIQEYDDCRCVTDNLLWFRQGRKTVLQYKAGVPYSRNTYASTNGFRKIQWGAIIDIEVNQNGSKFGRSSVLKTKFCEQCRGYDTGIVYTTVPPQPSEAPEGDQVGHLRTYRRI